MRDAVTWALVSNGVHARILRDVDRDPDRDGAGASGEVVRKSRAAHLRELLGERPGRSFASVAIGRRATLEPGSDPILRDMEDFAAEMVEHLERAHREGRFSRLAVFAAPKMLAILRRTMPDSLRATVGFERAANLVWQPEAELRETVRGMLDAAARCDADVSP